MTGARKGETQKKDGQTGSPCADKPVLARGGGGGGLEACFRALNDTRKNGRGPYDTTAKFGALLLCQIAIPNFADSESPPPPPVPRVSGMPH